MAAEDAEEWVERNRDARWEDCKTVIQHSLDANNVGLPATLVGHLHSKVGPDQALSLQICKVVGLVEV